MVPQVFGKVRRHVRDPRGMDSPRVSRWLAAILFPLHAVFMKRFFRIEMADGAATLPFGPFILAPTHRSRWDAFFLYTAVTNRLLYFMVSHDEFVGLQGWLMRRMGAFPITVHRPSTSAIRAFREVIARGDALVIFPEGNLFYYEPGEVHPLKPGAAWLALQFQKSCPDVAAGEADADEGGVELGVGRGQAQVGGQCQCEPGPGGRAVDGGDHRLG